MSKTKDTIQSLSVELLCVFQYLIYLYVTSIFLRENQLTELAL